MARARGNRHSYTSIVLGRRRSNHITTNRRVTKIAVNTDVMIPSPSVMAKPRTGPAPLANRITAVINVVMLASRIARRAFSYPN